MSLAILTTVLLAILLWGVVLIWAVWRAAWLRGAITGVSIITVLLVASTNLVGAQPVAYGITLGLSLFLGAAMVVMGVIAHAVRALARIESK